MGWGDLMSITIAMVNGCPGVKYYQYNRLGERRRRRKLDDAEAGQR